MAEPLLAGRYRLDELLASTSHALVYQATHLALDRPVAVKVIRGKVTEAHQKQFWLEARALAKVNHPNCAAVVDFGADPVHGLFLVMELVHGATLTDVMDQGPMTAVRAVDIALQLLAALEAVHKAGVVHGNVRPDSILVADVPGRRDLARLVDFGMARVPDEAPGAIVGTPRYLSPEQLRGRPADARSDLYAAATVLFELLTGKPPFPDTDAMRLVLSKTGQDAPAADTLAVGGEVPERMRTLLARALQRSPEARPQTAAAMRVGLLAYAHPTAWGAPGRVSTPAPVAAAPTYAAPAAPVGRDNLPPVVNAFVGREQESATLRDLLGWARVVTVVGAAGTGKTRLAVEVARELADGWPGGVWLVELESARDTTGVAVAVGRALGLTLDDPVRAADAIAARGRALFVLDNFEQIVDLAPETVGRWVERAPQAAFVVTTREALRLPGERPLRLEPLPLPPPRAPVAELEANPAVAMLIARAKEVRPDFDARQVPVLARIARALDGLPLAIELAAARLRLLTPEQLLERLGKRFALLSTGYRDANSRQATLRGAVDWSWTMLEPAEQAALAHLSVFRGPFQLEAAEAVIDHDGALDLVQALVDKSLLRTYRGDPGGSPGGDRGRATPWYRLYDTIRDYAAERLTERGAADVSAARTRHARYFASLFADDLGRRLDQADGAALRAELTTQEEDLRDAVVHTVDTDGPVAAGAWLVLAAVAVRQGPFGPVADLGRRVLVRDDLGALRRHVAGELGELLRLCGADDAAELLWVAIDGAVADRDRKGRAVYLARLGRLLLDRGHSDAERVLMDALSAARTAGDRHAGAEVHVQLGVLRASRGELDQARTHYQAAIRLHRQTQDRRAEGVAVGNLGTLELRAGRLDAAAEAYGEALALDRDVGDRRAEGIVLGNLGLVRLLRAESASAREAFEGALGIARELGNRVLEAAALTNLAALHLEQGDLDLARGYGEDALDVQREVGRRTGEGRALIVLGGVAVADGDLHEARAFLDEALAIHRGANSTRDVAVALSDLGAIAVREGKLADARARLDEALALAREAGASDVEGVVLTRLADVALATGDTATATAWLDAAEPLLRGAGAFDLARMLCRRGEAGRAEAREIAARGDVGPLSELARLLG